MANVLDALKNLYLKIGGDKSKLNDNHDISDYVNDIGVALKDAIESSTELPIVSVDDNGKALGVVDGNWGKMDIPSELPTVTVSDNKKTLRVVNGQWQKKLDDYHVGYTETYMSLMPSGQLANNIINSLEQGVKCVCVTYKKSGSSDKLYFLIGCTDNLEFYFINPSEFGLSVAKCSPSTQFTILY